MKRKVTIGRTRFASDIVAEYLAPEKKSSKVIILCSGMPSYPGRRADLMQFFTKQGYWVIIPRYRGTWESDGEFLKKSPHEDVIDIMNGVEAGFTDLWSGNVVTIAKPKFYLLGGSFGGPAVILASRDARAVKVAAMSPVIDWTMQEKTVEPIDQLARFVPIAFGQAYRGKKDMWKKLSKGNFYSPIREAETVTGKKLIIIHAEDDNVVPFAPAENFAMKTGATFVKARTGGHMGIENFTEPRFWKKIKMFLG